MGYYDDMEDPITGTNYHLVENGPIITYNANNSFVHVYSPSEYYNGHYSVSADSTLTMDYTTTASGEPYTFVTKILILTDSVLQLGGSEAGSTVYEKVSSN